MIYNREEILSLFSTVVIDEEFTQDEADIFYNSLPDYITEKFQDYGFGASKFVLIPSDYDYVIKIPFSGTRCDNYFYDLGEDGTDFMPFSYAWHSDWDYCEAEVKRYIFAKEHGLEDFLAKTEYLGSINGYPIYIQEKCITFTHAFDIESSHHSQEERHKTASLVDDVFFGTNLDWLTDCRLCFGEDKFIKFIHFIEEEGWNDLREDNIGYLNGRTVLIDYSGYDD